MRWWWMRCRSSSSTGSRRVCPVAGPVPCCTSCNLLYKLIPPSLQSLSSPPAALVGCEQVRQLLEGLRHARLRGIQHDGGALVDRLRDDDVARDQALRLDLEGALDLAHVEAHLRVGAVEDQVELRHGDVEQ